MTELSAHGKQITFSKSEFEQLMSKLTDREKEFITTLLQKSEDYRKDILLLSEVILDFVGVLGLLEKDKKTINPDVMSGEQSVFPLILKSVSTIISLMGQAQVPIMGRSAKEELEKKFSFIPKIVPLIKKYSDNGNN
jgi:hypothetical protein